MLRMRLRRRLNGHALTKLFLAMSLARLDGTPRLRRSSLPRRDHPAFDPMSVCEYPWLLDAAPKLPSARASQASSSFPAVNILSNDLMTTFGVQEPEPPGGRVGFDWRIAGLFAVGAAGAWRLIAGNAS